MGWWGINPWDNDGAADWYGDLFEATKLDERVEETLKLDATTSHEEVRAAAALLLALGRTYVWPIADLDRHLDLAANKLQEIINKGILSESEELVEEVRHEVAELRSRISAKYSGSPRSLSPNSPEKKWWQFWK